MAFSQKIVLGQPRVSGSLPGGTEVDWSVTDVGTSLPNNNSHGFSIRTEDLVGEDTLRVTTFDRETFDISFTDGTTGGALAAGPQLFSLRGESGFDAGTAGSTAVYNWSIEDRLAGAIPSMFVGGRTGAAAGANGRYYYTGATGFRRPSDNTWVVTNGFAVFKHPTQDLWIVAEGESRRNITSWSINTTAPPAGGAAYPLANNAAVPAGTSQVFIRGVSNSVYIHPATCLLYTSPSPRD